MMKPAIYLLTLLQISVLSIAQPDFTYADMPSIGDHDSLYHNPVYTPTVDLDAETGLNYTWNFSNLSFNGIFWAVDSFRVKTNPVSAPFADAEIEYFHQAATGNNLELYSFSNDTLYTHRTGGTTGGTAFIPPVPSIHFPVAFGEASQINVPLFFGSTPTGERTTTTSYDGFGTLNLPDGRTEDNVFRVKSVVKDTSYLTQFNTIYTNYLWYKQGGDIPLLRIYKVDLAGSNGTIYNVYMKKNPSILTSIDVQEAAVQFSTYPNPSSNYLKLEGIDASGEEYVIYNTKGKEMESGTVSREQKIDIGDMKEGTYFLKLGDQSAHKFFKR